MQAGKDRSRWPQYEFLAVELGLQCAGLQTSIHLHTTTPARPAGSRTNGGALLDGVDGVVFVADLRPDRHEDDTGVVSRS